VLPVRVFEFHRKESDFGAAAAKLLTAAAPRLPGQFRTGNDIAKSVSHATKIPLFSMLSTAVQPFVAQKRCR